MSFVTPALLAGIALIAVPIALHLIMRREARQLTFPALRFVRERRRSNRRRMRLRHWLLLALRCAVLALAAMALARPVLRPADEENSTGPPAVATVVDNSLRMQLVRGNRTLLEEATDQAARLIAKLPDDALVVVSDLGRSSAGFSPDLSAAAARLERLRPVAGARPLADAVAEAIELVAAQEERRPEAFVFTDLSSAAWSADALKQVSAALEQAPLVHLYLVDVGVEAPHNASLGPLELRRVILRPGEPLRMETAVRSNVENLVPLVEASLVDSDGAARKRGQQIASLDETGEGRVAFEIADLSPGVHQGVVELAAPDPLQFDNKRYFTVEVRPAAKVLLVGENPDDALFVRNALAPALAKSPSRFETEFQSFDKLQEAPLDDYQAVLLLDPGAVTDETWNRLYEFCSGGGGLGMFLGHRADVKLFNAEAAQRLLPGKLLRISREQTYLRPRRLDHPSLAALRNYAETIPWPACETYAFWQFDQLVGDAYVVAAYANDEPAIIERQAGRGRLLITTTPFSDPLEPEGREPWNVLPAEPWPFVILCEELTGYLAQEEDERLDYLAGETARIRLAPREQVGAFVLRQPDGQAESRMASAGESELAIGTTETLGNYRLTAGGQARRLDKGFSVNADPAASDLTRADRDELVAALPKKQVRLESDLAAVLARLSSDRSGRELYPWLIPLVAMAWGAEHLLANRFYRYSAGAGQPRAENA
jgi:hypothetical protein